MRVRVLNEAGYEESAIGFSKSWNSTPERAKELFPKFAQRGGGEDKFLESIVVWLEVTAPRYWWAEADTYRISTKQSESTMHTLTKQPLTQANFERQVPSDYLDFLNAEIALYSGGYAGIDLEDIKNDLPEGFLQTRIWMVSYKTLKNIVNQRKNHKLSQWRDFCSALSLQLTYPEFIFEKKGK